MIASGLPPLASRSMVPREEAVSAVFAPGEQERPMNRKNRTTPTVIHREWSFTLELFGKKGANLRRIDVWRRYRPFRCRAEE